MVAVPAVDLALLVAVALLVGGVLGSIVPMLPGGLLSLVGVYGYWWSTGFAEPGATFVAVATVLALLAMAVDYFGGAAAARASGTSTTVAAVAGVVGLLLVFVTGPLGVLLGVAGVVFLAERRKGNGTVESVRVALYTVAGMVAGNAVQFLATSLVLVGFLVVVVL